jgi:hypothetical protein
MEAYGRKLVLAGLQVKCPPHFTILTRPSSKCLAIFPDAKTALAAE